MFEFKLDSLRQSITPPNLTLPSDLQPPQIAQNKSQRLFGGYGDDILIGGNGDDILTGNGGNNVLTGGGGRDTFELLKRSYATTGNSSFSGIEGNDRITDFTPNVDKLKIGGIDTVLTEIVNGRLVVSKPGNIPKRLDIVESDSAAELSASKIVYNSTNGKLFCNLNGVAPGFNSGTSGSFDRGGLFATLEGAPNLTEADIIKSGNISF